MYKILQREKKYSFEIRKLVLSAKIIYEEGSNDLRDLIENENEKDKKNKLN